MNRPLRIAVFVGSFPVVSETFILRQITGLLDAGHDVRIFSNARPESGPAHPEVAKYDLLERTTYIDAPPESIVSELSVYPLTGKTWPPGSPDSIANWRRFAHALPKLASSLFRAPGLMRQLLDTCEYQYEAASLSSVYRLATLSKAPGGFDVLHAHFGPVANSFRFARKLWQAPLVVSFHGYDFSTWPRKQGLGVYAKLFATADIITINSEHTRQQVERLGCPPAKLRKLPVGLDLSEFAFAERSLKGDGIIRVLTVGRLVEKKGLEYSISAVARVQERHPNVRYDIIGEGPLKRELTALIENLGCQKRIVLHGAKEANFVRRSMAEAHLFLLASVTATDGDQEGQGLVLQEAQASGLPVLATNHAAFAEGILPGKSGLLVPERDENALATGLEDLVTHPGRWDEMGRVGRAFVEERYDIRKLNDQLTAIYSDTIKTYRQTN